MYCHACPRFLFSNLKLQTCSLSLQNSCCFLQGSSYSTLFRHCASGMRLTKCTSKDLRVQLRYTPAGDSMCAFRFLPVWLETSWNLLQFVSNISVWDIFRNMVAVGICSCTTFFSIGTRVIPWWSFKQCNIN